MSETEEYEIVVPSTFSVSVCVCVGVCVRACVRVWATMHASAVCMCGSFVKVFISTCDLKMYL